LQAAPAHIKLDDIQRRLVSQVDGVLAVHEFHVWQLAGDQIVATARIRCRNLSNYMKIIEKVKELFQNEGIHSTTIQLEFTEVFNSKLLHHHLLSSSETKRS
jgi:Co/Zn/Cd efflux system component